MGLTPERAREMANYPRAKRINHHAECSCGMCKPRRIPVEVRFQGLVMPEPNTGCHLWLGHVGQHGYGMFGGGNPGENQKTVRAHRFAWITARGPIPEGMVLDHTCRVRTCVNPDHLRVVTHLVNMRENTAGPASRTHCAKGHEFTAENTLVVRGRREGLFHRQCRTCNRARNGRRVR